MSAAERASRPGVVLVVDDDVGLQESVCDLLQLTGLEATGVGSAGEATRWCEQHQPDLVVLDQRLPDASGLELAARLKAGAPLLPVVLMTGFVSTGTAIEAVGVVDDYLTKPVPPNELIAVVRTQLEQHRLRVSNARLLAQLTLANDRLELTVQERTRELSTARDAAMESSRLKSQFLANMSHEIRTPMNGVLGVAQLLAFTELSEEQQGYVDILTDSGQTLLNVINDILDLSKIEAGGLEVAIAPFFLLDPFVQVVDLLTTQAADKGLELTLTENPALPEQVLGDAGLVRQVVTNLVGNAIKFTDAGRVVVGVAVHDSGPGRVTVRCEVCDTGIGVVAQDVPRLFAEFAQAEESSTRRYGGTGLGLAISDRLVRRLGGEIGGRPNPGGGSTFWFTLPFELPIGLPPDLAAPPPAAVPAEVSRPAPKVLIVEDNEVNALVLERMLGLLDYRADIAASGAEALVAVEREAYAAVLMDCHMPGMDGLDTTRSLRAREGGGARVPIIAVTGTATTDYQAECLDAGMDDYLTKPITLERIRSVLQRWAVHD
jgi:signal transduction histidine kinase